MPIGFASYSEPHPGISADWLILGPGWVLAPVLVAAGSAAAAALALTARRRQAVPRRSAVAAVAAAAGLGVPVVVGARFALEPGRGRAAVPVRPALLGAVAGVLGVLAAFTFAAGVSDAAANPARFGQTWQLDTFLGLSGHDFTPAAPGPAGGGRRSGCHRRRRRTGRRRAVRPGLGGELHLYPGSGQAGAGGAHRRADAGRAGRDRARPHHRQRHARGHRLGGPAVRRRGAAGR